MAHHASELIRLLKLCAFRKKTIGQGMEEKREGGDFKTVLI